MIARAELHGLGHGWNRLGWMCRGAQGSAGDLQEDLWLELGSLGSSSSAAKSS